MSLHGFCSNRLWMAIAQNVQIPARNPAVAPHARSVLITQSEGQVDFGSTRNIPRLAAIKREKTNVHPKIFDELPFLTSASVNPLSFIHALPNKPGEYQIPPTTKEEMPATNTASQLIVLGSINRGFDDKMKFVVYLIYYLIFTLQLKVE